MLNTILGVLSGPLNTVLDRVLPDRAAREAAQLEMARLVQEGAFKDTEQQLSAIISESKHESIWTSGARPSIMWVFSLLMLAALPIGLAAAIATPCPPPIIDSALACDRISYLTTAMTAYWASFPTWFSSLATACFLGYTGARTVEKFKGVANGKP